MQGKICWDFPLLGTGSLSGSNNPAKTMFKGSGVMDGLAREVCQNSLDARDPDIPSDKAVCVKFKMFEIEKSRYPMFKEFGEAVQEAYNYWNNNPLSDKKTFEFLDLISKNLSSERIPVLIMSDYNTTGLNGVRKSNEGTSYWDLLVNTEGISIKQSQNSAGSFGIGKNAPFIYSGLSMVFYNTFAKDGGRGFEGVTHLVTTQKEYKGHKRPTLATGKYLFLEDEYSGRAIYPEDRCSLAEIEEFQRSTPGTDVAIFGFKTYEYENWEDEIAIAILKNFILAINDGKLVVEIESPLKKYSISKDFITHLMYEKFYASEQLKFTRQIYETVTKTEPKLKSIVENNDLSIYVKYDNRYAASLARFRSTGMMINTTNESLPHYSVVVIVNDVGDMTLSKSLREAEPPQHTEWKPKNVTDNPELKRKVSKYIRKITKEIQNVLDEFDNPDVGDQVDAGIGNYLPDSSLELSSEETDALRTDLKIQEIISKRGQVLFKNQYDSASTNIGNTIESSGIKVGQNKTNKISNKRINVVTPTENGVGVKGVSSGQGKVKISSPVFSEYRLFYNAIKLSTNVAS